MSAFITRGISVGIPLTVFGGGVHGSYNRTKNHLYKKHTNDRQEKESMFAWFSRIDSRSRRELLCETLDGFFMGCLFTACYPIIKTSQMKVDYDLSKVKKINTIDSYQKIDTMDSY
jgi:hypothetical protein